LQTIPVMRPKLPVTERIAPYMRQIDGSRIYSNFGPLARSLESRLAARFGTPADGVASVANATLGLALALVAQHPKPGSLCAIPAWTFAATPHAVTQAGLVPYFVDVDPGTWALDPETLADELARAPGTVSAVMPVAPFGQPIDVSLWDQFRARTGLAVVIENALLYAFRADTRTINLSYSFNVIEVGPAFLALPRVIAFGVVVAVALALWLLMQWTDTGKAIRAVAKEKLGAELSGIDVAHIYAVTFGLGTACLAIAACLLLPTYYVNPSAGNAFVLIAFTIVVLGGMGSVVGALVGGLLVGVVESLSGLYLGESLGQIGIFVIFILVLLFRPSGLFGERA